MHLAYTFHFLHAKIIEALIDDNFLCYTADFGFARFLEEGNMAVTLCGSPMYMVIITFYKLSAPQGS